jgi:hypothetical protein
MNMAQGVDDDNGTLLNDTHHTITHSTTQQ